jgi:small subunit ribosomal protein S17
MDVELRNSRKSVVGEVVSDKMDKTVIVKVTRTIKHPVYGKVIKRAKKFYAHDETFDAAMGDIVTLHETRPLSKLKRWRVANIITKSQLPSNIPDPSKVTKVKAASKSGAKK